MSRAATIIAGIAMAAGAALAQEQETPVEEFDESVVTEENRQDRTGTETETQGEHAPQPEMREPYETQADERPTPMEDRYDPRGDASTYGAGDSDGAVASEQQPPTGVAPASAAELGGKTVVTASGEEVGTVGQVGYSQQLGERVATVNVGGFLGAGDKIIAIPISELGLGREDDKVTTSMTRTSLEQAQEFDPSQLVTAE